MIVLESRVIVSMNMSIHNISDTSSNIARRIFRTVGMLSSPSDKR